MIPSSHLYKTKWRTWRVITGGLTEDTLISPLNDDELPTGDDDRRININPDQAVMIRLWGQDAADETCTVRLVGWNNNGPGTILWNGTVTLGALTIDAPPFSDPNIWGAGTWYEADTWTATTNVSDSKALSDTDVNSMLVLNAAGYNIITCEITDKDGTTGTQAATIGVAYREVPLALALGMIAIVS